MASPGRYFSSPWTPYASPQGYIPNYGPYTVNPGWAPQEFRLPAMQEWPQHPMTMAPPLYSFPPIGSCSPPNTASQPGPITEGPSQLLHTIEPRPQHEETPSPSRPVDSWPSVDVPSDEELVEDTPSTWASQNPHKPVVPSRTRINKHRGAARQNTRKVNRELRAASAASLAKDLSQFIAERDARIQVLANTHHKKPEHIHLLLGSAPAAKQGRQPNLYNALLHQKSVALNKNEQEGSRARLAEIQEEVAADLAEDRLSQEAKDAALEALRRHREAKQVGVRVSNRAAEQDFRAVFGNVDRQIDCLGERIGSFGFGFLARGHLDDISSPVWFGNSQVSEFFKQHLGKSAEDICQLFELWAINRTHSGVPRDTYKSLRADITKGVSNGLHALASNGKLAMNYKSYNEAIILKHKVKLVGWTYPDVENPKLTSPSEIGGFEDLLNLRNALRAGSCRWVKATASDVKAANEAVAKDKAERLARGEPAKKRKQRSDKGKKRQRTQSNAVEEEGDGDRERERSVGVDGAGSGFEDGTGACGEPEQHASGSGNGAGASGTGGRSNAATTSGAAAAAAKKSSAAAKASAAAAKRRAAAAAGTAAKRRKVAAQLIPAYKSREYVDSDEDESDN